MLAKYVPFRRIPLPDLLSGRGILFLYIVKIKNLY